MVPTHLPISCEEVRGLIRRHMKDAKPPVYENAAASDAACDHPEREIDGMCEECLVQMLPELIELVCSDHEQPVSHFSPTIRRMVEERWFIDENGDSVVDLEMERRLDHKVVALILVLEDVQQRAVSKGEWSHLPAAPIMFG